MGCLRIRTKDETLSLSVRILQEDERLNILVMKRRHQRRKAIKDVIIQTKNMNI